jgi:hypothetical protein
MKVKLGARELSTGLSFLRQAHAGVAGVAAMFTILGDTDTAERLAVIEMRLRGEIKFIEKPIQREKQHWTAGRIVTFVIWALALGHKPSMDFTG